MHLFQCIIGALIVILFGVAVLMACSTGEDPLEKEEAKIRQMYPVEDDPDYAYDNDNMPVWRVRKSQAN